MPNLAALRDAHRLRWVWQRTAILLEITILLVIIISSADGFMWGSKPSNVQNIHQLPAEVVELEASELYESAPDVADWSALARGTRQGAYPAGIYANYAKEVDMSSGAPSASYAIDGIQHGFFGKGPVAATEMENDPWLRVDVGQVREIVAVELWVPRNPCESLKGASKCHPGMPVSAAQPLVISLSSDLQGPQTQQITLAEPMSVFTWDRIYRPARFVTFSLPGSRRQLHTTEVKVWVKDPTGELCTERSCRGGACVCMGPHCNSQVCRCSHSRIGTEDCMTDPLKDWRYLPLQSDGPSDQWNPLLWNKLMGELRDLQSPRGQCQGEVFNGLIGAGGKGAGLASTLHFVTGQLSEAYLTRKPFVFGGRFNYAGTAHCKKKQMLGDFDCYFEPFSSGSCSAVKAKARKAFKGIQVDPRKPKRCPIGRLCAEVGHFKKLPPGLYGDQGLFWWRTAMAAHLLRVNPATQALLALEDIKRKIGFVSPIIGVHVRHGDACHTTIRKGRCKGLSYYLPEIRTMSRRYNTTRVYLATDDAAVVKEASRQTEFEFVYVNFDRGILNSKDQIEYRKDLWDGSNDKGHKIMLSSLTDLLLLSQSDYLITHFLSNMSRLAVELAAANHQRVPPYISMDGPWCHHWKMCTG